MCSVECVYHIAAIVPPSHRHTRHMIEDEEARGDINPALQLAKLGRGDRSSSCSCCRLPPGRPRRLLGLLLVGLDLHQQQHEQKHAVEKGCERAARRPRPTANTLHSSALAVGRGRPSV
eukprot:COSAG02_NODE_423_length_22576_cov_62.034791_11_plen_119_part_00